jgi:hypothetical protein
MAISSIDQTLAVAHRTAGVVIGYAETTEQALLDTR